MPQFHLIPFPNNHLETGQLPTLDVAISGQIERIASTINLHYLVNGDISKILWPVFKRNGPRQPDLWQHTCFELFIWPLHQTQYYEYNLSPSGGWNAYGFSDYRNGKRDLPIDAIEIRIDQDTQNSFALNCSIAIVDTAPSSIIKVGISAVIEDQQQRQHFFALSHRGKRPDFHLKESFTIELNNEAV